MYIEINWYMTVFIVLSYMAVYYTIPNRSKLMMEYHKEMMEIDEIYEKMNNSINDEVIKISKLKRNLLDLGQFEKSFKFKTLFFKCYKYTKENFKINDNKYNFNEEGSWKGSEEVVIMC